MTNKSSQPLARIIRASAGTGKTYRLALEYLDIVLRYAPVVPDICSEIAVVTFTRKATAEIRERILSFMAILLDPTHPGYQGIAESLVSRFGTPPPNERLRQTLKGILNDLHCNRHKLNVSTLDSLTGRFFRDFGRLRYHLVEFTQTQFGSEGIYQEILERIVMDDLLFASFERIFNRFIHKGRDVNTYQELIKTMITLRWYIEKITPQEIPPETLENRYHELMELFRNGVGKTIADCWSRTGLPVDKILKTKNDLQGAIISRNLPPEEWAARIPEILDDRFVEMNLATFHAGELFQKRAFKKHEHLLEDYDRETYALLLTAGFYRMLLDERRLLDVAGSIYRIYDEIRFRKKVFTFDDITYDTARLLTGDNPLIHDGQVTNAFYERMSSHYRFLLIDEFQDTSVIQWSMLRPLVTELLSGSGIEGRGGFVAVGDEKQAIYEWRGGERELLMKLEDTLTGFQGWFEHLDLTRSYRSDEEIVNFVNRLFAAPGALGERMTALELDWECPVVDTACLDDPGYVEVYFDYMKTSGKNKRTKSDVLSDFLQDTVLPALLDPDPEKRARIGSSVILARKNDDLREMAAILDQEGIPVTFETTALLREHRIVRPIVHLMRYLAYYDPVDLFCFLRSDWGGLSESELDSVIRAYRQTDHKKGVYQPRGRDQILEQLLLPEDTRIAVLFKRIEQVETAARERTGIFALSALIVRLFMIDRDRYTSRDFKNLDRFLRLTRNFDRDPQSLPQSFSGFLSYLDENEDENNHKQVGMGDDDNVLRLLTIHKSKGLQFDNVFYFFKPSSSPKGSRLMGLKLWQEFDPTYSQLERSFLFLKENSTLMDRIRDKAPGLLEPRLQALEQQEADMLVDLAGMAKRERYRELVSELQALYVAVTRARHRLYIRDVCSSESKFLKIGELTLRDDLDDGFHNALLFACDGVMPADCRWSSGSKSIAVDPEEAGRSGVGSSGSLADQMQIPPGRQRKAGDFSIPAGRIRDSVLGRKRLLGAMVHDYLEQVGILRGKPATAGRKRIYALYGNICSKQEIDRIVDGIDRWIEENPGYYDSRWTRVLCEFSLLDSSGKEYRVDRVMIDDAGKKVLIIDYKTGAVTDPGQLHTYRQLLAGLPEFKDYTFLEPEFVDLEFLIDSPENGV